VDADLLLSGTVEHLELRLSADLSARPVALEQM
jgi:hypothetical protein